MLLNHSLYLKPSEQRSAFGTLLFLFFLNIALFIFIGVNRTKIPTPAFQHSYSNLFQGIHLTRSWLNIYYFPTFLLRRFSYFLIPIIFVNHPSQQLQFWLFINILYIIYFNGQTRFIIFRDNFMYGLNDFFCII